MQLIRSTSRAIKDIFRYTMRMRGVRRLDGWIVKAITASLLFFSLIINFVMFFRTHSDGMIRQDVHDFNSKVNQITWQAAEALGVYTRSPTRALILDSLLNCAVDRLETRFEIHAETKNMTGDPKLKYRSSFYFELLEKKNENMAKLLKEQKSSIAFLSEPPVNSHEFTYMHNPSKLCSENNDTEILFVVPSAPDNFHYRKLVRAKGRGTYCKNPFNRAKLLFFLGAPPLGMKGLEIQAKIDKEFETYGDIVQESFIDTYSNITLKAVSMLKWAITFCPQTKFVFRTDDDIQTDVSKAMSALRRKGKELDNFILGQIRSGWEPIRNPKSKYFMSKQIFPPNILPNFALGALMAYPISTVKLLYQAALRVQRLPMDDVYITALCSSRVGVPLVEDSEFNFKHRSW